MKVGSIVKCVIVMPQFIVLQQRGNRIPELEEMYIIRSVEDKGYGILLEEIVNTPQKYADGFVECAFVSKGFREVLPPQDLTELLEECSHLQLQNI